MWRITHDYINKDGKRTGKQSHDFNTKAWASMERVKFRLLDDDGNVYYHGQMDKPTFDKGSEEKVCAPLDWAMADAGCTLMQYKKGSQWVDLCE